MEDKTPQAANADSMAEALRRLSKKPGVKAWLMLDRTNGAVLKTNGQVAAVRPAKAAAPVTPEPALQAQAPAPSPSPSGGANGNDAPGTAATGAFSTDVNTSSSGESAAARELAALIWRFMSTAGDLVDEMDTEDELKLLRLRSRKQELVIVPEAKYLLVVIHDTPPV